MTLKRSSFILIFALCAAFPVTTVLGQQNATVPLTNASVTKLVRAGFKEKTVIAIIRSRPGNFNLDPDHLIELKRNGVSENIILTMLALGESVALADSDWDDDSFFKGKNESGDKATSESPGGETNIFGSGEGSKNKTTGRGLSGSNQGETTTTGSATVRILRPPAEASGAPLKLEKTPTLNNESIIKLVDAGFSEGTIIKRIEDSPADYDLSQAQLAELRRRRVTDAIIAAMTLAMAESPRKTNGTVRSGEN